MFSFSFLFFSLFFSFLLFFLFLQFSPPGFQPRSFVLMSATPDKIRLEREGVYLPIVILLDLHYNRLYISCAFYGRRIPSPYLCPHTNPNITEENTDCISTTAIQVSLILMSECQDRQECQIPVVSPVFGQDLCPETSKYIIVSYKCKPGETPLFEVSWQDKLLCAG
uniref:SUEL-type lectin domain-containing protein n=1 Tax=Sinocyclocheilus anshuiensis TaxID=1608454 RepID=A0A671Q7N2_9TELE